MHVTMQTLGRFALIGGTVGVALLNIYMFAGIEDLPRAEKTEIYARIYLVALFIPLLSVSGVALASIQKILARRRLMAQGISAAEAHAALDIADRGNHAQQVVFHRRRGFRRADADHRAGAGALRAGDHLCRVHGDRGAS
jgi:LytS/YehU family sensor histidine kinase